MNAGYVRLSRDDDKKNYVSIENQKLIIEQFVAKQNNVIDRWYEDDGFSGYKFDRPGFQQLMKDLDKDIDKVYVKDFSRLGRHNAKVLLLLDEFVEREKQLIVIDDNYISNEFEDDTIGIKTWYNERYVKDTSKKIKRALAARQKEGSLMTPPPFGYKRNEKDNSILEIVDKEANYVKLVYDLYLNGSGYRKIATHMTEQGIPTPSMVRHQRELEEGRITKRNIALKWSDSMVKYLLDNDFYIGTLRLRKRARSTIHGKDKRVPKEEQYVFDNHHPAIVDKFTFDLIQDIKNNRVKSNYHGSCGQWLDSKIPNPFGNCLYCKDCHSRLTPIKRESSNGHRKYYICSTYNTKGKQYCSKAHLIEENNLMNDVVHYVRFCFNSFCDVIATYNMDDFESEKQLVEDINFKLQDEILERKKQLRIILSQKIKDLSSATEHEDLIHEIYDSLQNDILSQIHKFEIQLHELTNASSKPKNIKEKSVNALDIVNKIVEKGIFDRRDIEILIEHIDVDENGLPEIELKYGLSDLIQYSPADEMNKNENKIIYNVLKLILEDTRAFTSAKYLSEKLTTLGFEKSKKSVLPYIRLMLDMKVIEPCENPLKPYTIIMQQEEIKQRMELYAHKLHGYGDNRWYARNDF